MLRWTRKTNAAAVALAFGIVGAACTSDGSASSSEASKSAVQIASDAVNAMASLNSFHVAGEIKSSGQDIKLDFNLGQSVGGGSMSLGGPEFQIVDSGTDAFLKAGADFWQQVGGTSPSVANLLADRWITGFTASQLHDLSQFANAKNLVASFANAPSSGVTKGTVTSFRGHSAIPIRSSDGSTAYIAATGRPFLLGAVGPPGQGTIVFDQFNSAHLPAVPTDAINFGSSGR